MQKITLLFLFLASSMLYAQVVAYPPAPISVCDDNNDGQAAFDLSVANAEIIGDGDPQNLILTYHETHSDAETGVLPLPLIYFNIVSPVQTLYARLESTVNNNDFAVVPLDLMLAPTPLQSPQNL